MRSSNVHMFSLTVFQLIAVPISTPCPCSRTGQLRSLLTCGEVCFIFGGLCGRCLSVVLFCISLMTRVIEHLFIC